MEKEKLKKERDSGGHYKAALKVSTVATLACFLSLSEMEGILLKEEALKAKAKD